MAPFWNAFTTPNCSTITQSQVRDQKSRQPSRSSCSTVLPGTRSAAVTRIAAMHAAAATYDTASTAIAIPGLVAATRMPPIAVPVMVVAFSASLRVAFACCSNGVVTVCGTMPLLAGKKNRGEEGELPDLGVAGEQ